MKRKFLLPILSVCMVVALVSVGFAAWLITGNDTSDTATGNFVTYDVSNDYYTVTIDPVTATEKDGEGNITKKGTDLVIFGKPAATTPTPAYDWFKFDANTETEQLMATFTVTITPDVAFATGRTVETLLGTDSVQVTLSGLANGETSTTENTTATKYAAAVTNGILALPTWTAVTDKITPVAGGNMTDGISVKLNASAFTIYNNSENPDDANNNKYATATVTLTYAWGQYGDNSTAENPYFHFNRTANGSEIRTKATTALNTLNALNKATYYLRLAVVA